MSGHAAGKPAHVTIPTGSGPADPLIAEQGPFENRMAKNGGQVTAMPSHQFSLTEIGEEQGEDPPPIAALPSPAATEVHDPESQDIMEQIQLKGIKIRDFAYAPPYAPSYSTFNPSSTIEAIPVASTSTAHLTPASVHALKRTTELFDPYKALTEIDYRWAQRNRAFPVTGKTLRRLLDFGWLTADELSSRGHPMDVASLRAHDIHRAAAKEDNGGVEAFPWRPLVAEGTQPPTMEERRIMLDNYGGLWKQQDRLRMSKAACEEWRRKEYEEAAQKKREFEERDRERERERERKRRGKRKMEEGADIDYWKEEPEDEANSSCGPKRLRLSPSDDREGIPSSQDTHMRPLLPPKKQYPAPLQAYNPKLYPDAATIIQASSQSQPRPAFPDTPPAVNRADTPPSLDGGEGGLRGNTNQAQRLVHPRTHRGLGRTQTFTDFF